MSGSQLSHFDCSFSHFSPAKRLQLPDLCAIRRAGPDPTFPLHVYTWFVHLWLFRLCTLACQTLCCHTSCWAFHPGTFRFRILHTVFIISGYLSRAQLCIWHHRVSFSSITSVLVIVFNELFPGPTSYQCQTLCYHTSCWAFHPGTFPFARFHLVCASLAISPGLHVLQLPDPVLPCVVLGVSSWYFPVSHASHGFHYFWIFVQRRILRNWYHRVSIFHYHKCRIVIPFNEFLSCHMFAIARSVCHKTCWA